jgi:hypothetical protein
MTQQELYDLAASGRLNYEELEVGHFEKIQQAEAKKKNAKDELKVWLSLPLTEALVSELVLVWAKSEKVLTDKVKSLQEEEVRRAICTKQVVTEILNKINPTT